MMRLRVPLVPLLVALGLPAPALASAARASQAPTPGALYEDGPAGRFLLGGQWLFRLDGERTGLAQRFQHQQTVAGWSPVSVPNAWNATDPSEASMAGTTAWYRRDFRLPDDGSALDWVLRFESVNYRARFWLNGVPIGSHTGAYLPFELRLSGLRRGGLNRLVVRVDNRRFPTDFPPSSFSAIGTPTGGWWNYGGILREVYLRRIDRVDLAAVQVRTALPCASCAATIVFTVRVRNYSDRPQRVRLLARYGRTAVRFGTAPIGAGHLHTFNARLRIAAPRLWSPAAPHLYPVRIEASVPRRTSKKATSGRRRSSVVARYRLRSGIRSIKVTSDGRLALNGEYVSFRGVGVHEDDPVAGAAIDNDVRARLVADARELGATLIRAHYPLHPYVHELADRAGLMVWSEIPVYSVRTEFLKRASVRRLAADELRDNILANQNHASVVIWSIGNELSARPGPVQGYYIKRAVAVARALDPTRPVGLAVAGYPAAGCQPEYGPLDVLGINAYFGWYPGPGGQLADRSRLPGYLDAVRACYPSKAVAITEFGAEANRAGPVEEKGTWAFQQEYVNYNLGVFTTKPWLAGVSYWTLREFRVRPGWEGGNPRPAPPLHQKGLIAFDGTRKPAFFDAQRLYRGAAQFRVPRPPTRAPTRSRAR